MTYTDDEARARLRKAYGLTDCRQDENGTWWVGSKWRPDLLNIGSLSETVEYIDRVMLTSTGRAMVEAWKFPRGDGIRGDA
jgi:hypothetical protein